MYCSTLPDMSQEPRDTLSRGTPLLDPPRSEATIQRPIGYEREKGLIRTAGDRTVHTSPDTVDNHHDDNALVLVNHQWHDYCIGEGSRRENGMLTFARIYPGCQQGTEPFHYGRQYLQEREGNVYHSQQPVSNAPGLLLSSLTPQILAIANTIEHAQSQHEKNHGKGTIKRFTPSHAVMLKINFQALRAMPDPAQSYGHSTNYLGDARLKSNRSANIADDRNCSFWLMGLPANTSYSALLGAIRNAGKIYATNINAPTGEIATCAAKIVFFQRTAAETLMRQIKNGKLYVVGKRITSVRWNKVKSGEHPYREQSRAIRITGPADLMNFEYFEIFFSCRFVYVLTWKGQSYCEDPGMVSHEWHFASLRAQAKAANAAIEREFVGRFKVHWAPDPCDCYCSR